MTSILPKVGIFIDIENFIGHCYTAQLPLDAKSIVEFSKTKGSIVYSRVYGDIPRALKGCNNFLHPDSLRRDLTKHGFSIEDIPYITKAKNSADMTLLLDAYKLAIQKVVDIVIIVSIDKDYIPLYKSLKELGIVVVLINISMEFLAKIIYNYVDEVVAYKDIILPIDSSQEKISLYKEVLEGALKIPLPSRSSIRDILVKAVDTFIPSIALREWARIISLQTTFAADTAYRILITVFFGRGFVVDNRELNNPSILELPKEDTVSYLESAFYHQLLAILSRRFVVDLVAFKNMLSIHDISFDNYN